ncbi:MAG: hypothetical protein HOA58_14480 [Rhodospirillaceae bacterium]|jgi:hypothetical protein|nr:hypothetical protein [Rhodospirillaceae bacterium]
MIGWLRAINKVETNSNIRPVLVIYSGWHFVEGNCAKQTRHTFTTSEKKPIPVPFLSGV